MTATELADRYAGYLYAYPHKTAYRPIEPALDLADVWAEEPPGPRFLYVHVPFCEMRCGFCNLFTQSRPQADLVDAWLAAVRRQAAVTADATGGRGTVAQLAVGGGTPTILRPEQLSAIFDCLATELGADPRTAPTSVEVSPATATADRLAVLRGRGVERISIGIESFDVADLKALGRPQRAPDVDQALHAVRDAGFPTLNIDLIYGATGQSSTSWRRTLQAALAWAPEELYLYPLYRRAGTGLARRPAPATDDHRPARYELAREVLAAAGYAQVSMRRFRRLDAVQPVEVGYDCQDDGMIGLGCGSRSYTRRVHYSHDYAVARDAVAGIIDAYVGLSDAEHRLVRHGFVLDGDEQRRRYVIKSILRRPGLVRSAYRERFGSDVLEDLGVLGALRDDGLLEVTPDRVEPTVQGLAWSDAVGSLLVSSRVRGAMDRYEAA